MILALAGCIKNDEQLQVPDDSLNLKSASINNKFIVVLNEDINFAKADFQTRNVKIKEKAIGLLKKYEISGEIEEVYETALQGFTVKMAPGQARKLTADRDVNSIEADQIIALSPIEMTGRPAPVPVVQQVPWGITRVGGPVNGTGNTAWIIDTGIDLDHPELNVDIDRSRTFIGKNSTPEDENGHGTHVSGIIAAKNNTVGVVGVAAGATVVSVRVLNRSGSGWTSGVIAGVDYVAGTGVSGDVANMSLGGGISTALDNAVIAASKNVKFALAAGNESTSATLSSPARANGNNIYTVSAMAEGDLWASFSNFGNPPIDYCAPGVAVLSCYKNGGYTTMSGTSMAAPHVAGLLLLGKISSDDTVIGDPDGEPDPIAHYK
jgi:subtilisin family serine protease